MERNERRRETERKRVAKALYPTTPSIKLTYKFQHTYITALLTLGFF